MDCKKCPMCKKVLPLTKFHKDPSQKSGHSVYCSECKRHYKASRVYPPTMQGMKTCTKCKSEKHVTDFPVDKGLKGGRSSHCRICRKSYGKNMARNG